MGGLTIACIILAAACLILLIRYILLNRRIRKLAEQVDGFNSGTAQMLDVALQEDRWLSSITELQTCSYL